MTDKEMAVAIALRVLQFQARELAAQRYLGDLVEDDIDLFLAPELPLGAWFSQIQRALAASSPNEVLATLYRELFDPPHPPIQT